MTKKEELIRFQQKARGCFLGCGSSYDDLLTATRILGEKNRMNIDDLQAQHEKWASHNFPNTKSGDVLLGIVEEVGELSHAHLKMVQEIRGTRNSDKIDAIGDILIYMVHYCNLEGISMQMAMEDTWKKVSRRDWKRFPKNGVSK
jgi:NTP pyrophosphatase (non-canonical NTP hydrolase)